MTAWFRKGNSPSAPKTPSIDPAAAAEKLRAFIATKSKLITAADLTDDTKLFSSGLLDSLAFIELVLFVEKELHLKLADVTDVNMDSLDSIEDIISHFDKSPGSG